MPPKTAAKRKQDENTVQQDSAAQKLTVIPASSVRSGYVSNSGTTPNRVAIQNSDRHLSPFEMTRENFGPNVREFFYNPIFHKFAIENVLVPRHFFFNLALKVIKLKIYKIQVPYCLSYR